jgi:hypothetical protein
MLCDLSFKRKTELVAHMKARHPKSAISTAEVQPGDESYSEETPRKRGRKKKPVDQLSPNELGILLSGERMAKMKSSKKDKNVILDESFDSVTGKKKRGRPRKNSLEDKDAHRRCPDCKKVFFKAAQVPIHQRAWHVEQHCQFCYG